MAVVGVLVVALVAGIVALGVPFSTTPPSVAVAAPAIEAALAAPPPDPAPERTITSVDARARTPEQVKQARQESVRSSRMAAVRQMRTRIVQVARKQIGDRYVAGRMGPDAFDCSGFTRYVYRMATGRTLPHSSRAQYTKVKRIKKSQAQPGDLVFWSGHVGMMLDPVTVIHANAWHMAVAAEPLAEAEARILAREFGPITARRRP